MTDGNTTSRHKGLVMRLVLAAGIMFLFGFALGPPSDLFCESTGIRIQSVASLSAHNPQGSNRHAVVGDVVLLRGMGEGGWPGVQWNCQARMMGR